VIELRKQLKEIVGNLSFEETGEGMLVVFDGEGFWFDSTVCLFLYIYIYIHVLSPYISYRKICFSLQSSSIQFMQAQDPTVEKILDFESNLCGIEGLPTCNLDKCKVSYFSSLHIHSKIAGVDQAPGISSSHTSDTPVRLSGGSKSMAWVI